MKFTPWELVEGNFHETQVIMDSGYSLVKVRIFSDNECVIRSDSGRMLLHLKNSSRSQAEEFTKQLFERDFATIKDKLEIRTPHVGGTHRKKFMEEVRSFVDYGDCDKCSKPNARYKHEPHRDPSNAQYVCRTCKLKLMFIDAGG